MTTLASDPRTLAFEAYVYLYPLVTMEATRRQVVNVAEGERPGFGPPNAFHHIRAFPDADFRAVVRPNFDTLYSSAWVDLSAGPVVVHAPDTGDRYYMLPMLDMWTDVFANPGKRTTGTGARDIVLLPPRWTGDVPAGDDVIEAPTPWVWIIGRTQTNGPADYSAVHAVQDGYRITAVNPTTHAIDPTQDTATEPLRLVNGLDAPDFFTLACEAMMTNPPHPTDYSILSRIAGIGIVPGRPFDREALDGSALDEVRTGARDALQAIAAAPPTLGRHADGWIVATEMGVYGNSYLRRAVVTLVGLGANPAEDAVYPLLAIDADGQPPTGDRDYVLHFPADGLPPAEAFWSITMYDAEGFQAANAIDRFAIGDRDPLVYNPDGSLDIVIQHADPGPDLQANWLPAPRGALGITMRLYAPRREVLAGGWDPPPLRLRPAG